MDPNTILNSLLGLSVASILSTVILFVAGLFAVKYASRLLTNALDRGQRLDASLRKLISKVLHTLMLFVLIIICAGRLGLPVTSLVTILGALGLAVSLALQDSLKNLAGGIFLLSAKPFSTGHFIEFGGMSGTVQEIGIIHTILITEDNRRIYVPNGTLSGSTLTNHSVQKSRRLELTFTVPYATDLEKAKAVITQAIVSESGVHTDPAPYVRTWQVGGANVELLARVWVDTDQLWEVRSSLLERVKAALDQSILGNS